MDYIGLVEASYDVEASEPRWLQTICDRAAPSFEAGAGTFAFRYDLEASDPIPTLVGTELPDAMAQMIQRMIRNCPRGDLRRYVGHSLNYGAGSDRFAAQGLNYDALFGQYGAALGIRDARYACIPVDEHGGVLLGAYTTGKAKVLPGTSRMWMRSLCHLGLGLRLRRALQAQPGSSSPDGEAVLAPTGRLVHAEGAAKSRPMRELLCEAARRMDAARGPLRHDDRARALELWRGLVSGQWSLVDRFDRDGRRYLVAHRNPADVVDLRRLSLREQQIARLLAHGYGPKLIAYQLGLASSTVATQLAGLRRKLRVEGNTELIRVLQMLSAGAESNVH